MKIIAITVVTPASENIRGTSALPYHLIKNRGENVDIIIYSFNHNQLPEKKIKEVEDELNCKIIILPIPWCISFLITSFLGLLVRFLLPYPPLYYLRLPKKNRIEILNSCADAVIVYGEELSQITSQLNNYFRCIHILPDCESLFYIRLLQERYLINGITRLKSQLMLRKFVRMEKTFGIENISYYLVGDADAKRLKMLKPALDVHFFRHPHYMVMDEHREIVFHANKIKLLIAGQANLYMKYGAEKVCEGLCHSSFLNKYYHITFLGHGWNKCINQLLQKGFEVQSLDYVDNYIEEICKHDIQLTPIVIGTGTKGKVLDAMANGLLLVGTPYSLENIAIKNNYSCLEYYTVDELISSLVKIVDDRKVYERIAENGRRTVLQNHNANSFWGEVLANYYQKLRE
ncbi:hypothetical protein HMPREF3034_00508 [Prevotella sp. DNF00663]|uniref:glycosyltransferase n=1 Tax=Prevotella sp. DNF00663 TaxID=1384078 RepID=UPI0007824E12|nr:glycosyltransferase [Prevotella sp. DNF00663]KXB84905.1 hypothetical protein HMPREF3034_00508 [Prevotella sp. DNF00663]